MQDYSKTIITSNQPASSSKRQYPKFPRLAVVVSVGIILLLVVFVLLTKLRSRTAPPEETAASLPTPTETKAKMYTARLVYDPKMQRVVSFNTPNLTIPAGINTHDLGTPTKPKSDPNLFIYKVKVVDKDGIILKNLWYWAIKDFIQTDDNKIVFYLTLDFVPESTISVYNENEVLIWSGKM